MLHKILIVTLALSLVSACVSNSETKEPQQPDPRQGEEVNQICFNRTMDSWSPLEGENKALLVYDSRNDPYKLDLIGTCDPEWAMMRIATVSRGASNCLSRGDKIITDADMDRHDSCTIMKIYKWHPEKLENKDDSNKKEEVDDNKTEAKL
ncbi:DUF6491 family protein [Thalassotalea fonticola]|uniref:DUF6491 family protein n=1 Tax=Thalassotalea fonticola TaxID=3065649 RepID=A0ABZ0GUI4_9GAMM|nr:DUF6491 family protein [Colwelliaceae bacterium S1-1]